MHTTFLHHLFSNQSLNNLISLQKLQHLYPFYSCYILFLKYYLNYFKSCIIFIQKKIQLTTTIKTTN